MRSLKFLFSQAKPLAIGQFLAAAPIAGAFMLAGRYDSSVILGCAAGTLISLVNYIFLAYFACLAADKAAQQDVAAGQKLLRLSYLGRMAGLAIVLAVFARSGRFHLLTLSLPPLFTRPILTIHAFFSRKDGN